MKGPVGIWGLGESGVGAALLAQKHGYETRLVAEAPPKAPYDEALRNAGLSWQVVSNPLEALQTCEIIVRSPGIRPDHPALQALLSQKKRVISDLEWGWWHFPQNAQLWLVTGSTGKTSTTHLLAHLLQTAGRKAIACGNIGRSFCGVLAEEAPYAYFVLEASSFQLWDTYTLVPHLAVVTNLSPNHIDWHGSFEAYMQAKLHFVERIPETSHLLYDAGSERLVEALSRFTIRARVWPYRPAPGEGIYAWIENSKIICDMHLPEDPERWEVSYEGTPLTNPAQQRNALAASIAARLSQLRRADLRRCFETVELQPHRMEQVAVVQGVIYVNDSKATTTDAVWHALSSYDRPIVWIAGGIDKGNDWGELRGIVQARVKALVLIGENNQRLLEAFQDIVPVWVQATSMDDAVEKATALAQAGDVVLLSPGCASMDWFESYTHRGEAFRAAVGRLKEKNA
jgi:UDP-N-acetylmuramoylalanine--D-glutamate ligase